MAQRAIWRYFGTLLLQPVCLMASSAGLGHRPSLGAERSDIADIHVGELPALVFESFCLPLKVGEILPDRCSRLCRRLRAAGREQMRDVRGTRRDRARL